MRADRTHVVLRHTLRVRSTDHRTSINYLEIFRLPMLLKRQYTSPARREGSPPS